MSEERAERRLAAIFAADVVGYSRLMGSDEEKTLAALKGHRRELIDPLITQHRGRIFKTTGDGILTEFASVVDALRCATEMQARMAERNAATPADSRIEFRVGIHQGDVIVEDGDIFGDGVNIAARLEGLAEPGGICVSARVQEDVTGKLDFTFHDIGEQQLKNIARPVRVFRVGAKRVVPLSEPPVALPVPDKPSIAVLPFNNMSADSEQDFFADGIAEDVITALSRYPSLFVIARNSSFTYKGRAVEVRQVGRELGVRYVLEGSLRKSGTRIRVTGQLVEAETGRHVWAERYDRDLADIFAVQDEITEAVTTAIAPAIARAELQRAMRKLPESLDAWGAYQRGLWHLSRHSADDNALARQFFQRSIDLDPNFPGGYTGLAFAQFRGTQRHGLPMEGSTLELARRAVSLDGNDATARTCLGFMLMGQGDYQGALAEVEAALEISPNLADAHGALGSVLNRLERWREARLALENCIRLDPRSPQLSAQLNPLTANLYFSAEYEAAVEMARRTIRSYPDFANMYRWLAAALGQLGRTEEAREALQKAISMAPASFDLHVRSRPPWMPPKVHEHMLKGLRKAGWEG